LLAAQHSTAQHSKVQQAWPAKLHLYDGFNLDRNNYQATTT
jgi:hypothetical protein